MKTGINILKKIVTLYEKTRIYMKGDDENILLTIKYNQQSAS